MFEDIKNGNIEGVKLAIANGSDVNVKDEDETTPLYIAIEEGHTETANLLRKHGGKKGDELKAEGKEALKAKETMMLLTFQFPINLPKSNRNP